MHPQLNRCGLIEATAVRTDGDSADRHPQLNRCGLIEASDRPQSRSRRSRIRS